MLHNEIFAEAERRLIEMILPFWSLLRLSIVLLNKAYLKYKHHGCVLIHAKRKCHLPIHYSTYSRHQELNKFLVGNRMDNLYPLKSYKYYFF